MIKSIFRKIGFISIEVVIVGALVLGAGFATVTAFNSQATSAKTDWTGQLTNSQLDFSYEKELTSDQMFQLKSAVLSSISLNELKESVLALIDFKLIQGELIDASVIEQIKNDVLDALGETSPGGSVTETDLEQLKTEILALIPTNADTLDGFHAFHFATKASPTFTGVVGAEQVKFPSNAVQSTDANTLDDYEEGTFVPSFSATGATFTYDSRSGVYTKIGRQVTVSISIDVSNRTGTGSSAVTIAGLPFATMSGHDYGFAGSIGLHEFSKTPLIFTRASSNVLVIYKDDKGRAPMTASMVSPGQYTITITYFAG